MLIHSFVMKVFLSLYVCVRMLVHCFVMYLLLPMYVCMG